MYTAMIYDAVIGQETLSKPQSEIYSAILLSCSEY